MAIPHSAIGTALALAGLGFAGAVCLIQGVIMPFWAALTLGVISVSFMLSGAAILIPWRTVARLRLQTPVLFVGVPAPEPQESLDTVKSPSAILLEYWESQKNTLRGFFDEARQLEPAIRWAGDPPPGVDATSFDTHKKIEDQKKVTTWVVMVRNHLLLHLPSAERYFMNETEAPDTIPRALWSYAGRLQKILSDLDSIIEWHGKQHS